MEPSQKTIEMVFGFPKAGEVYGSFDVVSSNFDPNAGTWSVLFADKVNKKYALQALKPFLGKVAVFEVDGEEHSVEFPTNKVHVEYVRTNPPTGVQTLVQGRFTTNTALQNPTTVEDFEEELGKMTVKKPTKWFRVHPFKEVHSPAFRDKLWSFVTRRGESYGWVVGNEIYHRKGSLIMPYVKINKHVENAKVMYHTHPSKDEPSFSSADDIQWYLDAAYKWNIRHYYTIMANRLDHFEITTKGDKGRNSYLRMDEGKFISDLDTMLTKLEEQYKGEALTDEMFCQKVTRKWVEEINKRFGHILDIKYHSHIKKETPLKNPGSGIPLGVSKRIALDDKHISTALGELKGLDYDWIHYGGDEFAHTMYVYWWTKYHFLPKADGTDRLYMWEGLSKESRVKLRKYLAAEVEAGWTRADVLLMLGLYHDIAKRREKQDERHHSIIGAEMFRQEIGPEIGASQNITDIVSAMLDSDVGRRNITDEEFKVISSDMYILTRLFHMADRTAHHPYMFTNAAAKAREEGTLQVGDYGKAFIAMRNKEDITEVESLLRDQVISNPAPKIPYSVMYTASYEIAIDPDTSEMLFEEYDPRKVEGNDGKFGKSFRMSYGQGLYIRMPLRDGYVASASVTFAYPGKLNLLGIPARDDFGLGAANEVYQRVGQILSQVYNPNVERLPIENMEDGLSDVGNAADDKVDVLPAANVSFPIQPIVNPKHHKLSVRGVVQQPSIVLAGPMGSGRREVAKKLAKQGYQICPMHTTQPSPPNRTPMRDSVDHTKESFMQLVKDDQMPYWMMDERGNCYGYTKEQLNAPKTVMYTSPTM
ncbi:MAG: HD domain-containing protein, partial [Planktomarina sp.]|nr:HD domain-containing protein [Planktomarina sp.]